MRRDDRMTPRARLRAALLASTILAPGLIPGIAAAGSAPVPTGLQVVGGSATATRNGNVLTIDQTSERAILDWQSFDLGKGGSIRFDLPNPEAIELDRVITGNPAEILGSIRSNGQIVLVDPGGVVFGGGATVDVGALAVSTLGISNGDFMSGDLRFARTGAAGAIINDGTLRAGNGGYVALLAPQIRNAGLIEANLGNVTLASGDGAALQVAGHKLLDVKVKPATVKSEIDAGGVIRADGGKVLLTAQAENALYGGAINAHGVVEADSLTGAGGQVSLLASGNLDLEGATVSAHGATKGGEIETSGGKVNLDGAHIALGSAGGASGTWLVDPVNLTVNAAAAATIDKALATGNVTLQTTATGAGGAGIKSSGAGDIVVASPLSWSANTTLTLKAYHGVTVDAPITASGAAATLVVRTDSGGSGGAFYVDLADPVTLSGATSKLYINGLFYKLIRNGAQLQDMTLTGNWALDGNLTLSGFDFTPIGYIAALGPPYDAQPGLFTGNFEGLGHTIKGLTINVAQSEYLGLFSDIGASGTVENLDLSGGSVTLGGGVYYAGMLAGASAGTISNVATSGTVTGGTFAGLFGGLIGANTGTITGAQGSGTVSGGTDAIEFGDLVGENDGTVSASWAIGTVTGGTGSSDIGGLIGRNEGTLSASYASGAVSGGSTASNVGGLAGQTDTHALVVDSYAIGTVTGGTNAIDMGGLVGLNYGTIQDSYATGNVTGSGGSHVIGGLVGQSYGSISTSDATGRVSDGNGSDTGALVGYEVEGATLASSYATDGVASGTTTLALVGLDNGTTSGSSVLSYAASFAEASYAGWDFTGTWYMLPGYTRPFLRSEWSTTITNAHQLELVALDPGADYTLAANIALGSQLTSPSGMWNTATGFVPIGFVATGHDLTPVAFAGTFDGNGHTISGLVVDIGGADFLGLFSEIGKTGTVEDLALTGATVTLAGGYTGAGILAGENLGTITGDLVGGAVRGGTTDHELGGLAGANSGTIELSSASVAVAAGADAVDLGGLAGLNSGEIVNAYATGAVTGGASSKSLGGLVGNNSGTVDDTYATGRVSGTSSVWVGALIGANSGKVASGYATGGVTAGTTALKLIPENTGTVTESSILSYAASHEQASYAGFDFTSIWTIDQGVSPPKLK